VPTCVDKITEEQEKMAKAREMHRLNELERKRKQEEQEEEARDQVPPQMLKHQDSQYAINQTLSKMNERIESAKRKMEMHSKIAVKRESTEFYEASDSKPRIEVAGGDSTGATKATGGRMSIGSDVTPINSGV
jgi:membrane-associated HD superfamily phosphohydrolase